MLAEHAMNTHLDGLALIQSRTEVTRTSGRTTSATSGSASSLPPLCRSRAFPREPARKSRPKHRCVHRVALWLLGPRAYFALLLVVERYPAGVWWRLRLAAYCPRQRSGSAPVRLKFVLLANAWVCLRGDEERLHRERDANSLILARTRGLQSMSLAPVQ
jgi:hypothetical protein